MFKIFRYDIILDSVVDVEMPKGAEVLPAVYMSNRLGDQPGLTFWARVDASEPLVRHIFSIVGTGHELNEAQIKAKHVGAVQDGGLVWHLLDVGERQP